MEPIDHVSDYNDKDLTPLPKIFLIEGLQQLIFINFIALISVMISVLKGHIHGNRCTEEVNNYENIIWACNRLLINSYNMCLDTRRDNQAVRYFRSYNNVRP